MIWHAACRVSCAMPLPSLSQRNTACVCFVCAVAHFLWHMCAAGRCTASHAITCSHALPDTSSQLVLYLAVCCARANMFIARTWYVANTTTTCWHVLCRSCVLWSLPQRLAQTNHWTDQRISTNNCNRSYSQLTFFNFLIESIPGFQDPRPPYQ